MKKSELKISHGELWYTYSTYITSFPSSLESFGKLLVAKGFTSNVFSSDGYIYYFENNKFIQVKPEYKLKTDRTQASFSLTEFPKDSFSKECIYESFLYRYHQQQLLSLNESNYIDVSYIRFSLGEIVLQDGKTRFHLYPFMTIYLSKVVIVEYRCIIDYDVSIKDFIENYISLPSLELNECFATENIIELFDEEFCFGKKNEILDNQKDFSFPLTKFYLKNDSLTLNYISNCVCDGLFRKINCLLNKDAFPMGARWFERTDIHILKFNKDFKSTKEFFEQNPNVVEELLYLSNTSKFKFENRDKFINLRQFDDYLYYFLSHRSLTIHLNNIDSECNEFLNEILSTQVINQYISFYNILFEIAFQNILATNNYSDLLHFQEDILLLERDMACVSHYGEINDVMRFAINELEIDKKKELVKNLLDSKKSIVENKQNVLNSKISFVLTIIFGLISSSAISQDLIIPIWNISKLPKPNADITNLISYLFSLLIVLGCLIPLFRWVSKLKKLNH